MTSDVLTMSRMPDSIGQLEAHFQRELAIVVEEWSRCTNVLSQWEDENLLDNPSPEQLAKHKQMIERLQRFGQFLASVTEQPDFPDKELAAIVSATQNCLRDDLTLWHSHTLSEEQRAEILKACFNES